MISADNNVVMKFREGNMSNHGGVPKMIIQDSYLSIQRFLNFSYID